MSGAFFTPLVFFIRQVGVDMKLLIYNWTFVTKHDLYATLNRQGVEGDLFTSKASPRRKKEKEQFREELDKALAKKAYDAIFSVNYFQELAEAANERDILYICWTYDSPNLGPVNDSLRLETNRIFVFDSAEYGQYQEWGVKNLHYLPLAVDTKRLDSFRPTPMEQMRYRADVSFVGRLYQSDMDKILPLFDEYGAGYVAALINTQLKVYGTNNIIGELINGDVVRRLCNPEVSEALLLNINENSKYDVEQVTGSQLTGFLLKAVTNKERVLLLSLLAKYHHVKLYTTESAELQDVHVYGPVDYVKQMPLVFKCSKINLNITLRKIRHAMPQRILDIMGCRALALTNYQKDIFQYFEDGKELLVYSSLEEAADKCRYYLSHEKEAEKIRQNGYRAVRNQFSYENQLNKIWETCGLKGKLSG